MTLSMHAASSARPLSEDELVEALVDYIADHEGHDGVRSSDLTDTLTASRWQVLNQLHELEVMGLVRRTGNTRGTRWWLA